MLASPEVGDQFRHAFSSPLKNSFLFQNTGANPLILLGVILAEQHFSTDYYIMLKKNCQPLKNKGILQNSRQAELPFL